MPKIIVKITGQNFDIVQDSKAECLILPTNFSDDFISEYLRKAAASNKIVLLTGTDSVLKCHRFEADGVLLDLSSSDKIKSEIMAAKDILKDKYIGVISRNRRHEAMIVSEQEPDFVVFRAWQDGIEKVKELVNWYSELFLIQSAVECEDEDIKFNEFEADIAIINDKEYKILVAKNEILD